MTTATVQRTSGLSKTQIAELSAQQISRMETPELVSLITSTQPYVVAPDLVHRLSYYDRSTLERLAHLARRSCQRAGY
jgi:hypothetical protein